METMPALLFFWKPKVVLVLLYTSSPLPKHWSQAAMTVLRFLFLFSFLLRLELNPQLALPDQVPI